MSLSCSKPIKGKIYYIVKGFRDNTGKSTSRNERLVIICYLEDEGASVTMLIPYIVLLVLLLILLLVLLQVILLLIV